MKEPEVNKVLRMMAWQRAKGELNSILDTYDEDSESHSWMHDTINEFVIDVEKQGPNGPTESVLND